MLVGAANLNRTLEDAWREISPYLDEALELEGEARRHWLQGLQARAPAAAAAVRSWLAELDRLNQHNFMAMDVAAAVATAGPAGRRFGAYTLECALGHGGMGSVWLAQRSDGRFEGEVAIKLLNASLLGRDGEERFRREGHLLARLEHPNIARLLDAGVGDAGQPFLVLEYVRGQPINKYCAGRRLEIRARIELFLDVLAAVSHAHSRLIIHRDLKPANIFVTATGALKLLDFGIAKLIATQGSPEDLTQFGSAPRTLTYASPEQITGVDIGTASDVYSLGVLLYELLTGVLPYVPKRDTLGALEEEILVTQPLAPSRVGFGDAQAFERHTTAKKLRRTLRGDLDVIVLTALKKPQLERYPTAAAFAEDLKRYLRGEPILEAALVLARVQFVSDANAAALATAEQALRERAANSRDAPRTKGLYLELRSLRARSLSAIGQQDEAAREYASLLPELRAAFGSDTHQYAVDLYEYSMIEQRRGELRHAIALGEQALEAAKAGSSSDRGVTAVSFGLALSCLLSQNFQDGLAWALRARAVREEIYGAEDKQGRGYQAVAIFASGLTGDPLEAATRLRGVVDRQREDDPRYLPRLLWFLGSLYLRAGHSEEAAGALDEAEKLALASEVNQRFQLPVIRADLGWALLNLGKQEDAAAKFQAALSGEGVPHTMTPTQAKAQVGLARVLLLRHQPQEALARATAADDFWRNFDPKNPARNEAQRTRALAQRAVAE